MGWAAATSTRYILSNGVAKSAPGVDWRSVRISAIVPAYQAAADLPACLAALNGSTVAPLEIIVVDDGSTDGTADAAKQAQATYVRVEDGPRGPAAARNRGARAASGDVLLFIDADVAVHPDTLARVVACFDGYPDVAAVFGSYDDRPTHGGIVSRYRNLLHHYVHQHGGREAATFWAGCGAVRRGTFLEAGGFDERYRHASIEDIELGARLRDAGHRIRLCPEVLARHMKRWTLGGVVRTDIFHRAIPWSRLILSQGRIPSDLNTSLSSRLSAIAAWLTVVTLVAAIVSPAFVWAALIGVLVIGILNAPLYAFFIRQGGLRFPIAAIALHGLYLLYSSAVFGVLAAATWLQRAGGALSGARTPGHDGRGRSVRVK